MSVSPILKCPSRYLSHVSTDILAGIKVLSTDNVSFVQGEYLDWSCYSKTRNTYAEDLAYVQYCEAIENETKVLSVRLNCKLLVIRL